MNGQSPYRPNQPNGAPTNQPINPAYNQPINSAYNQPINPAYNQPTNQPMNSAYNQPTSQPMNPSYNQPISKPMGGQFAPPQPNQFSPPPMNKPMNMPINQPINPAYQPVKPPTMSSPPMSQPISQSINPPVLTGQYPKPPNAFAPPMTQPAPYQPAQSAPAPYQPGQSAPYQPTQSVNQPINQPVNQPVNQQMNQQPYAGGQPMPPAQSNYGQPPVNQANYPSPTHSMQQPSQFNQYNQPINQSMNPPQQFQPGYGQQPSMTNQPMNQQMNPPMNQQIIPPMNQSINQSPIVPEYVQPVSSKMLSLTCSVFPNSSQLRLRSQIPFGGVLRPLAPWPSTNQSTNPSTYSSLPVVNPTSYGVIRCADCRAYVNPYVQFTDGGQRWRCNLCGVSNELPPAYFSPLDQFGRRLDVLQRPELVSGAVEIIAPADYMLRPPMPPSYVFLVDCSLAAVQSGVLTHISQCVKQCLDSLPGAPRTQIAFLTFDSAVHYYTLKAGPGGVSMWVCADLDDIFLPQPNDLLVNLEEARASVDELCDSLPNMFRGTRDVESCFGAAVDAAMAVMSRIGGRLSCFLSVLPSIGLGRLSNRENMKLLGTDKENTLLQAAAGQDVYKKRALEMSKMQISCDLYLMGDSYMDIATLGDLSTLTGGSLAFYPNFQSRNPAHVAKLSVELTRALTREQGWESVVRIRASRGVTVTEFHGNFHLRGSDLLALPAIDSDKAITFELRNADESVLTERAVIVQAALLYTTSEGERRIRVLTTCLPVTQHLGECYDRLNCNAAINVMMKHAVRTVYMESVEKARDSIRNRAVALMRTYRSAGPRQPVQMTSELMLLPLMTLAAIKNLALKEGSDVRSDVRAFVLRVVYSLPLVELETFLRPRLLPVHDMSGSTGLREPMASSLDSTHLGPITMPPECPLTAGSIRPDGAYLLDNGLELLLRIGRAVNPQVLQSWFGVSSIQGLDSKQLSLLPVDPSDTTSPRARLHSLIDYLRELSPHYQVLFVVKEGDLAEARFFSLLVEDRQGSAMSLHEFEEFIARAQY